MAVRSSVNTGLSSCQRGAVLAAAFLGWMFAGLEISLFILIHRQMLIGVQGAGLDEAFVTRWFAWFQAAFLFGAAAGGWLFGALGDRLGRKNALALAMLCYSLFTLACYPATSLRVLLVLRLLACLGIGGVWPNAVALAVEAVPNMSRPVLSGILGAAANVGFVLMGVLGYFVPITAEEWRWTLLVGAAPAGLGVLVWLAIPESPRWQELRQQAPVSSHSPVHQVFQRPLLYRTLLGIGLGAIPVIGTAANANWLTPWTDQAAEVQARQRATNAPSAAIKKPADARSKAKTQITRSGGAILGSLLGGLVASLVGRRWSYFLISLATFGISTYIFTQLDPLHPHFQWCAFALGFAGVTYFGWLPLFLPELFPTRVRATGAGICFNTGRVAAGVVVLSAGFLLDRFGGNYRLVGVWSGLIYVVGMILIWFAPRTNTRLED